jgi:hypothetical protein
VIEASATPIVDPRPEPDTRSMTDADLKILCVGAIVASVVLSALVTRIPEASTHPWARQTSRSLKPRT